MHRYVTHLAVEGRESVAHGVEPFAASRCRLVRRHVEAGREVAPQLHVGFGQNHHYLRRGQSLAHEVYRARQHGHVAEHHELLGHRAAHSAACTARHYYYSCLCHISFFPNPSVLSVSFIVSASMRHKFRSAKAAYGNFLR